ncbi:TetR/AcrR family transcriptional regulator [Actinopolymorpha alba]|uniref:TetR/AcrR family transcriptional regulator n=1 Tax=Actinopolymorpha alba TaxID=533267 RepID=UPI000367A875|nr:TetR family transcriptional regulator [Actinopolymorpha alba]
MGVSRSTAAQRREQAISSGMRVIADQGLTTAAMQQVADEIGVSQPYVFRLFGSKQAFFLACLDELERRVREVFGQAAATHPRDPLKAMGGSFRELVADGVITGLWLQACATARRDERVAARCRSLVSDVLDEAERLTGTTSDDLARFLANGALVMLLQALGVDLTGGSRAAVDSLRAKEATE